MKLRAIEWITIGALLALTAAVLSTAAHAQDVPTKIAELAQSSWTITERDTAGRWETLAAVDGQGRADRARMPDDSTLCFIAELEGALYVNLRGSPIWTFTPDLELIRSLPNSAYLDFAGCAAALRTTRRVDVGSESLEL